MIFCKHKWKVLSETVTQSMVEMAIAALAGSSRDSSNIPAQLCQGDRKHIQIVTCEKCGKLQRYVERL